jgi:LemA protein
MTIIYIILAVVVLWLIAMFNGLIRTRTRVDEAWADIDVQLKRRYDLIPNLVETVKGYAAHESGVLEKVTEARNMAIGSGAMGTPEARDKAENALSGTLKSLFAVAENYPDLKANQNFLSLQSELSDTENKIQAARRFYNSVVRDLNTKISVFPTNIFANMFGFAKREFFGLDAAAPEREAVKVSF